MKITRSLMVVVAALAPSLLLAQGLILPTPVWDDVPRGPVQRPELRQQRVEVQIYEQVAEVNVSQTFFNPNPTPVEGVYYFPLPHGAQVSSFAMYVDGKKLDGEMLSSADARKIYDDIVRRKIDPALLELVDYQLFRANIFPIPGRGERKITLSYEQLLSAESGTLEFVYPLRVEIRRRGIGPTVQEEEPAPGSQERAPLHVIEVKLSASVPLQNLYSPSHEVDIERDGDRAARVSYEGDSGGRDFILVYSFSADDIGLSLLTHRPSARKPGFFMLLVSPRIELPTDRVLPKDLIFVLDTSGSMQGEKIRQAREALRFCVEHLNREDRFNLVTFSSDVRLFQPELVPIEEYRRQALDFIDQIKAKGGTNINEALLTALSMVTRRERPTSVIFLTDGLPTTGVTRIEEILTNVRRTNAMLRIFPFGVGNDVNTRLLDALAEGTQGSVDYIAPDENIEERVSEFFEKISRPVLADLELDFGDLQVEDFYPQELLDLFVGSQVTVVGRYRRAGRGEVVLSGKVGNERRHFRYNVDLPSSREENDFLPRLWAARKIGHLLDQIRLHGEREELKEQIVELSKTYGVMSPYTSLLVQEDEPVSLTAGHAVGGTAVSPSRAAFAPEMLLMEADAAGEVGSRAVSMSVTVREMKQAKRLAAAPQSKDLREVSGRVLVRNSKGYWVDTAYDRDASADVIHLKAGSEAVVTLLATYPKVGSFLALGDRLIFRFGDAFVKIDNEGKTRVTAKELRRRIGL